MSSASSYPDPVLLFAPQIPGRESHLPEQRNTRRAQFRLR
jgi:hypothetical protein